MSDQELPYLKDLNPPQLDAVLATDGALLVLAGAGTGKTRVLTTKIAHLINTHKCFPSQVLSVTFTNKAAKEMRSRVEHLLGGFADGMWIGTFHSIAARILRRHADLLGFSKDFTIIDTDDQIRLLKLIIKELDYDEKKVPAKMVAHFIGRLKDKAIKPQNSLPQDFTHAEEQKLSKIYIEYQSRLKLLNAVDFGDLLLMNLELFNQFPYILSEYHHKFKYLLVDEYQDTNVAQYLWLRILAQFSKNICCVGDDDQSIYGWRGAEVTNILRFDKDFPDAKVVRLEQNYRSTSVILAAAAKIIANNKERHDKTLWTEKNEQNKLKLNSFYDDREESRYIAEEIEVLASNYKHKFSDMAILLRAGHQTRSFEEMFNFYKIPYRIVGGVKFYERMEIRDSIAYIRCLVNPSDNLAFERIVNVPRRGVGNTTLEEIHVHAKVHNIPYFKATQELLNAGKIKGKAGSMLAHFISQFARWNELLSNLPHWQLVDLMLQESGYIEMWKSEATAESKERLGNIKELLRSLEEFDNLSDYLEHVSLITDTDNLSDDNRVSIMTIHAAKGLEFETVFLCGWEEGIFPSQKSIDENGFLGIEEERRLAYVAITRAKNNLYISYACNRRIYGSFQSCLPSRFINELPADCYEIINNFGSYYNKSKYQSGKITSTNEYSDDFVPEHSQVVKMPIFHKGQKIQHNKFGFGIILSVHEGVAEVAFYKHGMKKIMVEFLMAG